MLDIMKGRTILLYILTFLGFVLNLDAPKITSDATVIQLILDYFFVLLVSNVMVRSVLKGFNQKIRTKFYNLFLLSFFISLIILHFMWTPLLNPSLPDWGYDPLRYYYYASEIIRTGFSSASLSYYGVVYYNVGIMNVFGLDPLVPLFTNILMTFYAVLLIARLLGNDKHVNRYAYLLLIPEIISFDMMASREIICMSMVTVFVIKYNELMKQFRWPRLLIMIIAILLVAVIRPPMAGVAVMGIVVSLIFTFKGKLGKNMIVLAIAGGLLVVGLGISTSMGSDFSSDSLSETVSDNFSGDNEERNDAKPGLTTMLIPHNPIEYVVFGVIRSFAYVVPAPVMIKDFETQFSLSNYYIYEHLSTLIIFFFLPTVFRTVKNYKQQDENMKLIIILFVCYFFTIGISLPNLIHNRYRLVYDLFYFTIAIYGWTHKNDWKNKKILS